jgi:DNA-binding NtrC family response regulator
MKRVIVVDDKENILRVLKVILEKNGCAVETFSRAGEALKYIVHQAALKAQGKPASPAALSTAVPDLVISDIRMDDMDGRELFYQLRSRGIFLPFIFMTAYGSISDAVSLMKQGAVDYLTKPIDYAQLNRRIDLLLAKSAGPAGTGASSEKVLIGSSEVMQSVYSRIKTVSDTVSTILIEGESGTGKELVARAIHQASSRRANPFVPVNCSAFNENILESELFGHEKGAFTDAVRMKRGVFEIADTGTLFLDEVSELTPATQVKLLRVMQEKVFSRVGGSKLINTDVRIIAATNKRLQELIDTGSFRMDLYYRLNVIPFYLPPLRQHAEDISELASYFAQLVCRREGLQVPLIEGSFIDALIHYTWPGNVRELENVMERMIILHKPEKLTADHLVVESEFRQGAAGVRGSIGSLNKERNAQDDAQDESNTHDERRIIITALHHCRGNKSDACRQLGISRRSLYYKLERYSILPREYEP